MVQKFYYCLYSISLFNLYYLFFNSTKINFDSDEEEEEKLLSSSSSSSLSSSDSDSDGEKMYDAEDASTIIDDLNRHNKTTVVSPTEEISRKLNALSLESPTSSQSNNNTTNNKDEGDDDYKLNPVDNKRISKVLNQQATNSSSLEEENKYKLFMFGEIPSKLDRAVYLAIQGVKLDQTRYPFLSRWYSYMKTKQSDMQSWKTPTKKLTVATKQF